MSADATAGAPGVSPNIRRAATADLPTLVELNRRYCASDGHGFDAHRTRAALGPLLASDDYGVVWLVEQATVSGYAVVTWGWSIEAGGAEALLDELYVEPTGTGTGAMAIEHIVDDCRRRRFQRIVLETERANEAARRLYARHGFVTDDSLWMVLALDPPRSRQT